MFKLFTLIIISLVAYLYFKKRKGKKEIPDKTVDLVKDHVCGTYINKDTPYKVKYFDNIYYFCSEACQKKFIEEKKRENKSKQRED
ncbi:MAG: YHS domain-containing protein [Deferribacterota bacterium]|nr:YHS domain-containing protein [Deferribacterota bacterium]